MANNDPGARTSREQDEDAKLKPVAAVGSAAMAAAALVLGAEAAESAVHARDGLTPEAQRSRPLVRHANRRVAVARSARRRHPVRAPRAASVGKSIPGSPTLLAAATDASDEAAPVDTRSELRDWIKDNATLLSNASLLISLAALALNLLPTTGVLDPYIKALIFGAALLLLAELHHQWPEDLQLHILARHARPENHSWRMTAFAFLMQFATLVFAVWATLSNPLILLPLIAIGVVVAFRQWYFRRYGGLMARSFGILALIAVLLITELLTLTVWAIITDHHVTFELFVDERPGLEWEWVQ